MGSSYYGTIYTLWRNINDMLGREESWFSIHQNIGNSRIIRLPAYGFLDRSNRSQLVWVAAWCCDEIVLTIYGDAEDVQYQRCLAFGFCALDRLYVTLFGSPICSAVQVRFLFQHVSKIGTWYAAACNWIMLKWLACFVLVGNLMNTILCLGCDRCSIWLMLYWLCNKRAAIVFI